MPTPIVAVIAEYNPFHLGHAYHLSAIRKQVPGAKIIALMSGSCTQRGEPSLLDKWHKARLAIAGGIDLALELPFVYASRSAQEFARGGIRLASLLGQVTHLAFGAETDNLDELQKLAVASEAPDLQAKLHACIASGASYASALTSLLAGADARKEKMLRQPNNILAVEYLRALKHYAPRIKPLLIKRLGSGYHEERLSGTPSAAAIRKALYAGQAPAEGWEAFCPPATARALTSLTPETLPNRERLWLTLRLVLLRRTQPELRAIYGVTEGLENRLRRSANEAGSLQEFISRATTKRYPGSRIARLAPHLMLSFRRTDANYFDQQGPAYARILAASHTGTELLHKMKNTARIPLITKVSPYLTTHAREQAPEELTPLQRMLSYDTWATELRELALPHPSGLNDFQQSPYFPRKDDLHAL